MLGYGLNLCYAIFLVVLSPYFLYASVRKKKYRRGWSEKFLGRCPTRKGNAPCIWLHAVSVGEVQLLAPLLDVIAHQQPQITCVISTTTQTGRDLAEKKYPEHLIFYCPLDFTWAVRKAIQRIRPDLLVLSELELWPNLILKSNQAGIATAVINGRLSEKSFRGYRWIQPLIKKILCCFQVIVTQNQEYADRFLTLGAPAERVRIAGSIKFDGAQTNRHNATTSALAQMAGLQTEETIFLAGSTQHPEEALAIDAFSQLQKEYPLLKLILVPRHPERFEEVAGLLTSQNLPWQRRSDLEQAEGSSPETRILLVDTVGELGHWWGRADIGFVGGSLTSRGGQNMIEPAAYGVAICFGPHTENFRDTVNALQAAEAVCVVGDGTELTRFVRDCLTDDTYRENLGKRAAALVDASRGATDQTVNYLLETLRHSASPSSKSVAA